VPAASGVTTPPGYVIGPDDSLAIVFWREKELSSEVVVRPDGMISLPLLNDVRAEGLTPEQLRGALTAAAAKFVEEPTVTVVVKVINSRKVFITGQVAKPGTYPLGGPTTVLQLIALSGGVAEYADKSHIVVVRKEGGKDVSLPFNYGDVMRGKSLQQNIELKPGDTVIVP
jgi:polysaccharide export outer membrane protein